MALLLDYASIVARSLQTCKIFDCGELKEGEDWDYCTKDETADVYPPYPEDWEFNFELSEIMNALNTIKESGNYFFKIKEYGKADRKYKKAQLYINKFENSDIKDLRTALFQIRLTILLNLAAVKLQQKDFKSVLVLCTQVLSKQNNNAKALYRRSQALMGLNEYERALTDLKEAQKLTPNDKIISSELKIVSSKITSYLQKEKKLFQKMLS